MTPRTRCIQSLRLVLHAVWGLAFLFYVGWATVDGLAHMQAAGAMADAAATFVASLTPAQTTKAVLRFDGPERIDWHFIPRERKGVAISALSERQRTLAMNLVKTLGSTGASKVETIMILDDVLRALEPSKPRVEGPDGRMYEVERGSDLYSFTVYGEPSGRAPWGWSVEGHHVSVNITVVRGTVSSTPLFLGSAPAEVHEGPRKGLRPLAAEEDAGRRLLESLDDGQRARAVVSPTTHGDIVTFNNRRADPLNAPRVGVWSVGLPAGKMTALQKNLLKHLIDVYLANMPPETAARRAGQLYGPDFERTSFAWTGSTVRGERYYFRVQGPTFLIEHDGSQYPSPTYLDGPSNHIHSVWRDFDGDFGLDLLAQHYRSSAHAAPLIREEAHETIARAPF